MMNLAAPADFVSFANDLRTVENVVRTLMTGQNGEAAFDEPIFNRVEAGMRRALVDRPALRKRCYDFAGALLALENGAGLAQSASFFESRNDGKIRIEPGTVSKATADRFYIENLSAAWLVLYFLGEPFGKLWERVRRWVSAEGGGLPNGTCVGKAIGDIVRAARLAHKRRWTARRFNRHGQPVEEKDFTVMVLSHLPMVLFRSLLTDVEHSEGVSPEAHVLGRCYELLQMQLYAREQLPFKYFVSRDSVKAVLQSQPDPNAATTAMLDWLCRTLFVGAFPDQFVGLVDMSSLPAVFLNHNEGLYTFELPWRDNSSAVEIPLPASYMQEARRRLYRDTLERIPTDDQHNLLKIGRGDNAAAALQRLL